MDEEDEETEVGIDDIEGEANIPECETPQYLKDEGRRKWQIIFDELFPIVLSQPALACFQLFCSRECSTECNYVSKGAKYSSIVYLSNEKKNHLNTCSQS